MNYHFIQISKRLAMLLVFLTLAISAKASEFVRIRVATMNVIDIEDANIGEPARFAAILRGACRKQRIATVVFALRSVGASVQPADYDFLCGIKMLFRNFQAIARQIDRPIIEVEVCKGGS